MWLCYHPNLKDAYVDALAGDPVSAFGGVLITNKTIDLDTATEIHSLFARWWLLSLQRRFGAPKGKKNRILLVQDIPLPSTTYRSCLNGILVQERDSKTDTARTRLYHCQKTQCARNWRLDLCFKNLPHFGIEYHCLAKNCQLLASGFAGQTSVVH